MAHANEADERQFEIIGEALGRLAKPDQKLAGQLTDYQKIASFRNVLIHGYADAHDHSLLIASVAEHPRRTPSLHLRIPQKRPARGRHGFARGPLLFCPKNQGRFEVPYCWSRPKLSTPGPLKLPNTRAQLDVSSPFC